MRQSESAGTSATDSLQYAPLAPRTRACPAVWQLCLADAVQQVFAGVAPDVGKVEDHEDHHSPLHYNLRWVACNCETGHRTRIDHHRGFGTRYCPLSDFIRVKKAI
jgi:hypothetical protein